MNYGDFIYGWSQYSTADFTQELAVSLTSAQTSFTASVTKVIQSQFITYPDSQVIGDVIRVRLAQIDVQPVSSFSATVYKVESISLDVGASSGVTVTGIKILLPDSDISVSSSVSASGIRIFSLGQVSQATSGFTGSANFLSNVYATMISESSAGISTTVKYSAGMESSGDASVNWAIDLLYNKETKDNETYSTIVKGSDLYTVQTKQNEDYEVI